MSILHRSNKMGSPSFRDLKKQASFFLKEKIKTARLALTDVTPAQLLAEEVTSGNEWGPDMKTMRLIAKAAFEVDDYCRIVEILHKRFSKFDEQNWRVSYNSLILLEYLLTHGPVSAADEFQIDKDIISEMQNFQHTDEKGFNWGLAVRRKSQRLLSLLENRPLLKQEKDRARKVTMGIQGFGSFGEKTADHQVPEQLSSFGTSGMSDYLYIYYENNHLLGEMHNGCQEESDSIDNFRQVDLQGTRQTEPCYKENTACLGLATIFKNLSCSEETKAFSDEREGEHDVLISTNEDHHPFCLAEGQASATLLTTSY